MITILLPFCAGLSIFLVGMKVMRNGLESLAEKHLKTILLHFTKTPWRGMLCGTILTALLQSSTARNEYWYNGYHTITCIKTR
jgi:phosphate:Na+ symporter